MLEMITYILELDDIIYNPMINKNEQFRSKMDFLRKEIYDKRRREEC